MAAFPRSIALLFLGLLLLTSQVAAFAPPARAQSGPMLSGAPGELLASAALGSNVEVELRLRNESGAELTPRLFEARAATAQAAAAPSSATRVRLSPASRKVEPALAAELAANPGAEAEFLVFLADQAELAPAYGIGDWAARGEYVHRTLRDHAERSQRELRALLAARGVDYTPLWIVNALVARGDAGDLSALAARAEVAELRASRTAALGLAPAQQTSSACLPDTANRCWNIGRVGAGRVWDEFGVRGEGITVATIDSGARWDHPALLGAYRGNSGGAVSHAYNWYDVQGGQPAPIDSGNHGTHVLGTIVGAGRSAAEPAVGVAPGARWMAVRACGATDCSEVNLLLAAQWLLAPTDENGANPRPELRPHVINSSWTSGQNASWFAGYTAAWRAAGIYPVFAAGNSGSLSRCGTVQSPGDYADVTAVGATDFNDALASFSSIGPGPNGRVKPDLTAPGSGVWSTIADPSRPYATNSGTSMATPHVVGAVALLLSANPSLIGDYDAAYTALAGGARPLVGDQRYLGSTHSSCAPTTVPNNIYGYGRLDAYAAVARVSTDVPWLTLPAQAPESLAAGAEIVVRLSLDARRVPGPGTYTARVLVHGPDLARPPLEVPVTLSVPSDPSHATVQGQLTRAADGRPIAGTVQVTGGALVATDAQGRYSLTLPAATQPYTLTADARDAIERSTALTLGSGQQATLNFALDDDAARLEADTGSRTAALDFGATVSIPLTLRNAGSKPLSYTLSVPVEPFGVWRSDDPAGPSDTWTDPPADATTLALEDDGATGAIPIGFAFPFARGSYDQLYISANGVISFGPLPTSGVPFTRTCLPLSETPGDAIVPLRLDLNPAAPDAHVSYARLAEGFLVSWENVPLFNAPSRRLSFQALLRPDGRVSLRYRGVGELPAQEAASYGLQFAVGAPQSLGCRENLGLSDGLTIELRPQLPTSFWLQLDRGSGSVAPGEATTVQLNLRWARPSAQGWALRGSVVLQTNDPARRQERITVRLGTTQAPHTLYLLRIPNRAP